MQPTHAPVWPASPPAMAWYVYAVVPTCQAPPPGGILPDAPVVTLIGDGVAVLASRVPAALFDKASPDKMTGDPDWMADRIAAHHAAVAAAGDCLPLAFGSLFSTRDRIFAWMEPRKPVLQAALDHVARQSEWAVSLTADEPALLVWLDTNDPKLRQLVAAQVDAGEGAAFLIGRRLDKARSVARAAHVARAADLIRERLVSAGLECLPEAPGRALAAWTVLAPKAAEIPDVSPDLPTGLATRVTGPWPAYAFARTVMQGEDNVA